MRYLALFRPHSLKGPAMSKPLMSPSLIEWILSLPMPVPSRAVPAYDFARTMAVSQRELAEQREADRRRKDPVRHFILNQG